MLKKIIVFQKVYFFKSALKTWFHIKAIISGLQILTLFVFLLDEKI